MLNLLCCFPSNCQLATTVSSLYVSVKILFFFSFCPFLPFAKLVLVLILCKKFMRLLYKTYSLWSLEYAMNYDGLFIVLIHVHCIICIRCSHVFNSGFDIYCCVSRILELERQIMVSSGDSSPFWQPTCTRIVTVSGASVIFKSRCWSGRTI